MQRQIGDNMGVSASYLGNYLMNVWGDVTGNPGIIPAGASATGPCTLRNPAAPGGTQTFPNCSAAPLDVRREMTQVNPAVGQYIGYLDWVTDEGGSSTTACCCRSSAGRLAESARAPTTRGRPAGVSSVRAAPR